MNKKQNIKMPKSIIHLCSVQQTEHSVLVESELGYRIVLGQPVLRQPVDSAVMLVAIVVVVVIVRSIDGIVAADGLERIVRAQLLGFLSFCNTQIDRQIVADEQVVAVVVRRMKLI